MRTPSSAQSAPRSRKLARLACVMALGGAVCAGPFPASAQPDAKSTQVSGVTVVARRASSVSDLIVNNVACPEPDPARFPSDTAPRVIDSYPARGSTVAPGVLMVRVSFDAPMACYWAVVSEGGGDAAPCQPAGSWELPGRTTWRMQCKVEPGASYRIRFGDIDKHDFYGMSGRKAEPYELRFTTSSEAPVPSVQAALAADPGLPGAHRVTAYVTCSDRRFGDSGAPCERRGVAEAKASVAPTP